MVTLTRRRALQAGATSGALAIWPTALLLDRPGGTAPAPTARHVEGTTLQATLRRAGGHGYRHLTHHHGDKLVVREELATAKRRREDRREGAATLVQISDLHINDVQHPMRFEYVDRINGMCYRPQEMLTVQGAAALVRRINGLAGGPWTGRAIDAVVSTGDNTDNQSKNELDWSLRVLAGGIVRPDSGSLEGFEGVATSGHQEYWQPEGPNHDNFKRHGFPRVHGLVEAATRSFISPGLTAPFLLTMGNHDNIAGGMLVNRGYVEDWSVGRRKIFSSHSDATVHLAKILNTAKAGDDVAGLVDQIARSGHTRTVHADESRAPFSGADYLKALRDPRFAGVGPVGHGYDDDADPSRLYFSHDASEKVVVVSLDSTNQAGGSTGSIGSAQLRWLEETLAAARDRYVIVLSHHPSVSMDNLARDPRAPHDVRHDGRAVLRLLHRYPNVLAWVNGHTHHNEITPHRSSDPRRSFWEINSASHVDAPQQARVIEVAVNGDGTVSLLTTMLDSDAPLRASHDNLTPSGLASWYRELAYNDPNARDRGGEAHDRNTELVLADPFGA